MSNINVYDFNFDDTGYIGRDTGRKMRAEVGVGGRELRLHPYQFKEKQFSPTLCFYSSIEVLQF